ncbi:MAG: hypothetical protein LBP50_10605, partial [Tannerella sp.]|nr:hypothetical protein [Tannerella sp.]
MAVTDNGFVANETLLFIVCIRYAGFKNFLYCRIPDKKTNRKLPFHIIERIGRNQKKFFELRSK